MMVRPIRVVYDVPVKGQSFKGTKRCTVPNQSMSLREIVRRFIRRESLPVSKEGVFEERFGDLEKLSKQDIVIQMDKVAELKGQIADFEKREKARRDKVVADKLAADKADFEKRVQEAAASKAIVSPEGGKPG